MTTAFDVVPDHDGAVVTLCKRTMLGRQPVAIDDWAALAEDKLLSAVRYLRRLTEEGRAVANGSGLRLSMEELADLPASVASLIGLPPTLPISLELTLHSRVESPDGYIRTAWIDINSRRLTPVIDGLFISIDSSRGRGRLSGAVYRLLRAIDNYNATRGRPFDERLPNWFLVQQQLEKVTGEPVATDRTLEHFRIYQAGAFALEVKATADGPDFEPVLMAPAMRTSLADEAVAPEAGFDPGDDLKDEADHALLPPQLRRDFLRRFASGASTRPSYGFEQRHTYLVLEPDLRAALDVVKRMRAAPAETRRAFVRNPRTFLIEAMPNAGEEIGTIFVETKQYSERVKELGVWERPRLDWLERRGVEWLPERFVIQIGSRAVALDRRNLVELSDVVRSARECGRDEIVFRGQTFPAADVDTALKALSTRTEPPPQFRPGAQDGARQDGRIVLLIDDHIEDSGPPLAPSRRPRAAQLLLPSDYLKTDLKPHQKEGFSWLVRAWQAGLPGVLLADDMGLGKTLQALTFLTWFRVNRREAGARGRPFSGPILVVAPTALLHNWRKEAETHLTPGALGDCLEAFGFSLHHLRQSGAASPEDALDLEAIRNAGWVLTTYETLANYHRAFARVAFPVVVFDEIQKIKSPATINTHAAKTVNADFVLGMTGTPIENRIEDLWCIMDRIAPGYLGAMKPFSAKYGKADDDALQGLKALLDQPQGECPPIMLRRLKEDHIEGLPERRFLPYDRVKMPRPQADAYADVVRRGATSSRARGDLLRIIHELRGVSLHPHGASALATFDDAELEAWAKESARVIQALEVLDTVHAAQEKALVFIEDRLVQRAFSAVVGHRYRLPIDPPIINGSVPGEQRQEIVDRFQASRPGFGVLILSPRAAGMGLTITAANHVVHLSRWWNPAVEDQCNDRVYRIGQQKSVTVHIPMAIHSEFGAGSFDVKLDQLLSRKRDLSRRLLIPPVADGDAETLFQETIVRIAATA